MAIDTALSILGLAKCLVVPIGREIGYALSYKKNIQELRSEVEKLHDARVRVRDQQDAAVHNGEVIKSNVRKWLDDAKTEEEKVKDQVQGWEVAKKSCFYGWIPNPKTRYAIGRKAKKTALSIQKLREESCFEAIAHPDLPPGVLARLPTLLPDAPTVEGAVIHPTTKHDDVFDSRTGLLNLIVESLMDVNVIGVHGPGGVGKTTLMKHLVNRIKAERLFDEVAMAIVSENVDVKKIQGELGDMLGLKYNNESVQGRAFCLRRRLENNERKNVLIILDDLWKELDLEEVGIPRQKGLKLLLTSRQRDVLSRRMGSERNFLVEGLKDDEPWKLFISMVGDRANDPKMKPIAEEVVQKCSGLPIMLKALATALKNSKFSKWEDAMEQLRSSKDVYSSIELSYNNLEGEELKKVFLICSIFGRGRVLVEDLLRYVVGLGILEGVNTMKKARDRLSELLCSLQASSLLLDDDNSDYIRIHDIVREVAVTIASRDWHAIVADDSHKLEELRKDKIKKSNVISMPYHDVTELPEGLQCPELKMLLYYGKENSSKVPNLFFDDMRELQVVDFTNISFNALPSSIQSLENLTTLCVDRCTVEDVTIVGNLKRLQILSFSGSSISHLPKAIAQLSELRTLDLKYCSKLEKIEPGVLKSMSRLEELYMENSFTKWEKEGATEQSNARLSELNSMHGLSTLDILIPDTTLLPEVLPFENLFKYRILVSFPKLEALELSQLPNLEEIWWSDSSLELESVKFLLVKDCGKVSNIITSHSLTQLQKLESLTIKSCMTVTEVFDLEELNLGANASLLPRLHEIELNDLPDLRCLWNRNPTGVLPLQNLKSLKVVKCNSLKYLFTLSTAKALKHIKEIEVVECLLMEAIIMEEDKGEVTDIVVFQSMSSILLKTLSNLTCFALGNYSMSFPNLKKLKMEKCPKMKAFSTDAYLMSGEVGELCTEENATTASLSFFNQKVHLPNLEDLKFVSMSSIERIWHNKNLTSEPSSFCRLIYMHVDDCENLKSVFASALIQRMHNDLKGVEIVDCSSVEVIFEAEASNTNNMNWKPNAMMLYGLIDLNLCHLPKLKHVSEGDSHVIVCFPSLMKIFVKGCISLTYFLPNAAARYLLKLEDIGLGECRNMQEIFVNGAWGHDFTEPILFPHLKTLRLWGLNSLISFSSGSCPFDFPSLLELRIDRCDSFKTFIMRPARDQQRLVGDISSTATIETLSPPLFDEKVEFPSLKEIYLRYMGNLQKLWDDELPLGYSFSKLKLVTVENCNNLTSIFQSRVIRRFQNLETLGVRNCGSLEQIFQLEGETDGSTISIPLRELEITALPKMKQLWDRDPGRSFTFDKLDHVEVALCGKLEYLFPTSVARGMVQIQQIDIRDCGTLEELVARSVDETPGDSGVHLLFPCLSALSFWRLPNLKRLLPVNYSLEWSSLKILHAYACGKVKIFAPNLPNSEEDDSDCQQALLSIEQVIPNLEGVSLVSEDVSMIQDGNFPDDIFRNLTHLCLAWFEEGSSSVGFPSRFLLDRFPDLQITLLAFLDCSFEEMFPDEGPGPQGTIISYKAGYSDRGKYSQALKNLTELSLLRVHNLRYICKEDSLAAEVLKRIEWLRIESCHRLTTLFPTVSDSYQNLTELNILKCNGLLFLMTPSAARGLPRLAKMAIGECEMLRQLIADDGNKADDEISFPQLRYLYLSYLPSLMSVSSANCSITFPLLEDVDTIECHNMKIFSKGALSTPKLYKFSTGNTQSWYGDLNTTIQKLSANQI